MSLISTISMTPLIAGFLRILTYSGIALIPVLMSQYSYVDQLNDRLRSGRAINLDETFDFIVVGSGSSGSVVANRLSENYKVLLLEAGGEPFPLMTVPAMAGLFLGNSNFDWNYKTTPQLKSCLSMKNQQSLWPRGKALGGTSNLNFMAYIRGHPNDYDNWAAITGDERWNYTNVLPFFKKSEKYNFLNDDPNYPELEEYHGYNGELNVERAPYAPIAPYFLKGAEELGYPTVDVNAPFSQGFSNFYFTTNKGRRQSGYKAFLEKIRTSRKNNLKIIKFATVIRVLMKGSNNFAYGVEFEKNGKIYTAKSRKEIILSAGAINTPKILMLSGIGPAEHLTSLGIKVKVSSKVGQNLQDHVSGFLGPITVEDKLSFIYDRDTDPSNFIDFYLRGSGPLSSSLVEAVGLLSTDKIEEMRRRKKKREFLEKIVFKGGEVSENVLEKERRRDQMDESGIWPDLSLIILALPLPKDGVRLVSEFSNLNLDVAQEYYMPVVEKDSFHIITMLSRPKSRGSILLTSANYKDPPLINPNYLEEEEDVEVLVKGLLRGLELIEDTDAFKSIGAQLSPVPFPPCKNLPFKSAAYFECYVRHFTLTLYHPAGSCKMGKIENSDSVVDSELRVIGTTNLRVADASIMPNIITANIQSICIAIGEIVSDLVKKTWEKNKKRF